jgi:hypothetical protein
MNRNFLGLSLLALVLSSASAYAAPQANTTAGNTAPSNSGPANAGQGAKGSGKVPGACASIAKACLDAGFIPGDWKKGDGLWRDCVDPIVQGQTSVPGATKSLPTVDAKSIAACKKHRPKFGEGKVGSPTQKPSK